MAFFKDIYHKQKLEYTKNLDYEEGDSKDEDEPTVEELLEVCENADAQMSMHEDEHVDSLIVSKQENFNLQNKKVDAKVAHVELEALYDVAKAVIKKYKLRKLTENETEMVWMFNGRFYEPLTKDRLANLVYPMISTQIKRKYSCIKANVNHTIDFIRLELSDKTRKHKFFTEQDFAKIQNHIVFKNCVYDCKTGQELEFTDTLPYYMGVDANYVYQEEISGAFEKLKQYATGSDKESMDMFDHITAAIFLHRQIKHIFVAGNASNSGKSKYFEFLDALMPVGRSVHLEPGELKGKFALSNADTATLFSCADIQMGEVGPKVASTLKRLTGDQYVRCEKKFENAHEVRVMAKVLLGTNGMFATDRPDSGIQNRLIVLPFIKSVEPEHRDEKLLVKLLKDRDIILSHCARSLRNIIGNDDAIVFPQSAISLEMKNSWLHVCDFLEEFFQQELEITGNEKDVMLEKKLYAAYERFFYQASENMGGMRCHKAIKQELLTRLEKFSCGQAGRRRGLIDENGTKCKNAVSRVRGIKLKTLG